MPRNVYPGGSTLNDGEIRLIRLLPGNWNDEIKCDLVRNSLHTARPYYTLSYVWGSTRATSKISLDSKEFFVTRNLESALRHLRTQYADSFIWVDALCINQDDIPERTRQVKMMGNIYKSSQSVLVFLGEGVGRDGRLSRSTLDQTAPPAFTFSETQVHFEDIDIPAYSVLNNTDKISEQQHKGRTMQDTLQVFSFIQSLITENHIHKLAPFNSTSPNEEEAQAQIALFENLRQLMHAPFTPWWQRIWVVQEVVMPSDIIVICGTVSAPWQMFARAASRCLTHLSHCCNVYMQEFPRDIINVLKDFCHRVLDIDNLRSSRRHGTTAITADDTTLASQENRSNRTQRTSLITLLRRFRDRKATDPRDKVYALLSLVETSPGRPGLTPDYSLSDSEVYIRAALQSIYESASLSVLSIDATRKFRQDLPTWVPDWEAPGDFSHNERIEMMQLYDSCADHRVDTSNVRLLDRSLVVEGQSVDTITAVGHTMLSETLALFRETIDNWLSRWDSRTWDKWEFWKLLCAEAINHIHNTETGDIFRKIDLNDELMFVTWSIYSKRSPFYGVNRQLIVPSQRGNMWFSMVHFLNSIRWDFLDRAGQYFERVFEDENMRREYLLDAYKMSSPREAGSVEEREMLNTIQLATTTYEQHRALNRETNIVSNPQRGLAQASDISGREQFKKDQIEAFKKMPWANVVQVVRPVLQKKLGEAAGLLDIPFEDQAAIIDRSIASATKARKLFFTSDGLVGLGPADLEQGDKLFLIKGGRTPFILRDDEKYDKSKGAHVFKLLGDCYGMGLMFSGPEMRQNMMSAKSRWQDWQSIYLT